MKQKDIAMVLVVIIVSVLVSYFASNALFAAPKDRQQEVEVVQPITSTFDPPDRRYFNKDAFNPTKLITIGQDNNPGPFTNTTPQ